MVLKIIKLKKTFFDVPIFKDFNIEINDKEITCILGPSGIGKTTLLNIMSGITDADSGEFPDFKHSTISYIFQEPRLLKWKTVHGNIAFVLRDKYSKKDINPLSDKYINMVGLTKFKYYYPDNLSGGMKQRVSIARAFAYPSDILIMDEPFKSLDFKLKKSLINSFLKLWEIDKRTVLFVTHDLDEAAYLGNTIFILEDSHPTGIRKVININTAQKDRLNNFHAFRDVKNTLFDNLK